MAKNAKASACRKAVAQVKAVRRRLKWLDAYCGDSDTHRGVRLAVSIIRTEMRRAARKAK